MPSWQFRMFYLGEFAKPENLIYSDFSNDNIIEPFDIPPPGATLQVLTGLYEPNRGGILCAGTYIWYNICI